MVYADKRKEIGKLNFSVSFTSLKIYWFFVLFVFTNICIRL